MSPVPIETLAKQKIPIISHAVLVGDKAKFLSMLLTLKVDYHPHPALPHTHRGSGVRVGVGRWHRLRTGPKW